MHHSGFLLRLVGVICFCVFSLLLAGYCLPLSFRQLRWMVLDRLHLRILFYHFFLKKSSTICGRNKHYDDNRLCFLILRASPYIGNKSILSSSWLSFAYIERLLSYRQIQQTIKVVSCQDNPYCNFSGKYL